MNSTNLEEEEAAQIPQPHEEEQHKKKVRRKRKSQRLYKQIPFNMAQARREIVTALKLHRASTKQKQIKQSLPQFFPWRYPRIYPPACSLYFQTGFDFIATQTLNFDSPSQSLGLNLSFDDHFKTVNTNSSAVCNNSHSYFCSPVSCAATHQEVPKSVLLSEEEGKLMGSDLFWSDNKSSIGESGEEIKEVMDVKDLEIDDQIQFGFDSVETGETKKTMEFPDWLSINDDLLQQQNSNYHCAEVDCLQDPDLSCLDIGEIEDVDGDWLA